MMLLLVQQELYYFESVRIHRSKNCSNIGINP